jgi:hypothetical protein
LPFHPLIQLLEKIPPPRNFELIHVLFTESFHLLTDFFKTDWDPIDVLFSRPGLFRKIKVEFVTCVHWPESKQEEWESLIVKQLPLSEQLGILTANVRVVCGKPSFNCTLHIPNLIRFQTLPRHFVLVCVHNGTIHQH